MTIIPGHVPHDLANNMFLAESLKKHTTMKIGGEAEVFALAKSPEEVNFWVSYSHDKNLPLTVIGNGSNLLVSDDGIKGLVLKVFGSLGNIETSGNSITVFSGYPMIKLINWTINNGYGGMECLAGIPGTIGGAVVMNAGAKGQEIANLVNWVKALDLHTLKTYTMTKEELDFGYRKSALQGKKLIVQKVNLSLEKKDPEGLRETVKNILKHRKEIQPINFPNSGSVFKNPPNLSAGRLIDEVGLKGHKIGDAQISTLHANFIINLGNAKASEVIALINIARKEVKNKFDICLEPEVRILGGGLKLEEV